MTKTKQKAHCKDCIYHHTAGIKTGSHDNWCTKMGQPAPKATGRCIMGNYRVIKGT